MQRRLLDALEGAAVNESTPPLAWFERRALGFDESPSTRASFSRAAGRLHEMGLIERGLVSYRSTPSTSTHYLHARGRLHPDDEREMWLQGERLHSVVRFTSSEEDREELQLALTRWRDMPVRTRLYREYAAWLFSPGEGIWPDDPAIVPLSPVGGLSQVRRAISAHSLT